MSRESEGRRECGRRKREGEKRGGGDPLVQLNVNSCKQLTICYISLRNVNLKIFLPM